MIELLVKGADPNGETIEATVVLNAVPRAGDSLEVWLGDGSYGSEVFVDVEKVAWPTWGYAHLPDDQREPSVWLSRGDLSDAAWLDVFASLNEGRHP
jgi:hypothetical protein